MQVFSSGSYSITIEEYSPVIEGLYFATAWGSIANFLSVNEPLSQHPSLKCVGHRSAFLVLTGNIILRLPSMTAFPLKV